VSVASVAALIALKTVAMPRRAASHHPEKVVSDIFDLTRLVLEEGDLALVGDLGGLLLDRVKTGPG
jgi:hypothetical protein